LPGTQRRWWPNKLHTSTQPAEAVAATNVVDGLALLAVAGYDTGRDVDAATLRAALDLSSLTSAQANAVVTAIVAALQEALDVCDAVADLAVAEGVHQLVQGNPARSGGAVDALAGTETLLGDPGVTQTPRSGASIVQRMIVALDPAQPSPSASARGWATTARTRLDPALERWARGLLPAPTRIGVRIGSTDASGAPVVTAATLADLHEVSVSAGYISAPLAALDLVGADVPWPDQDRTGASPAGLVSEASALGSRLLFCARLHLGRQATSGPLRLLAGRDASWNPETVTLVDAIHLAQSVRTLMGHARPLLPADLAAPGTAATAALDLSGLQGRIRDTASAVDSLVGSLTAAAQAVDTHRADPSPAARLASAAADRAVLVELLLAADHAGATGALPTVIHDPSVDDETAAATLVDVARRIATELSARRAALEAVAPAATGTAPAGLVEVERARAQALMGRAALVTVDLSLTDGDPFAAARRPGGADDEAVRLFCARAARVRLAASRLDYVAGVCEAIQGQSLSFAVAQLPRPFAAAEVSASDVDPTRWVALPAAPGMRVPAGRASIVALQPGALSGQRVCGLAIDEWVEVVPATHETTSISFHYDAPSAAPPNVLLMSAYPPGRETWTLPDAYAIVDEALALARLRAVDPSVLDSPAPPIVGLVTRENTAGDVPALDVAALTAL
jgi:hypothetical protein